MSWIYTGYLESLSPPRPFSALDIMTIRRDSNAERRHIIIIGVYDFKSALNFLTRYQVVARSAAALRISSRHIQLTIRASTASPSSKHLGLPGVPLERQRAVWGSGLTLLVLLQQATDCMQSWLQHMTARRPGAIERSRLLIVTLRESTPTTQTQTRRYQVT